jgi:hypothetical protein
VTELSNTGYNGAYFTTNENEIIVPADGGVIHKIQPAS